MNSQKTACFSGEKTLIVDTESTKTLNVPGMASLQSRMIQIVKTRKANG